MAVQFRPTTTGSNVLRRALQANGLFSALKRRGARSVTDTGVGFLGP